MHRLLRFSSFIIGFAGLALAGCASNSGSGTNGVPNAGASSQSAMRSVQHLGAPPPSGFATVYTFKGSPDGEYPRAGLIDVNGTLYGTTVSGGGTSGTVYSVTTTGVERVLYAFANSEFDGSYPVGDLIDVNGKLYGTTERGGYHSEGTAYRVSTVGAETVLHSFGGKGTDGQIPLSSLINVGDTLYGTTEAGGAYGTGTFFRINNNHAETVLYSFAGGADGKYPEAGLVDVNGTLYGTTQQGGAYGYGTVYSISLAGVETVLYSFAGGLDDGLYPVSSLINVNGTLYGTTEGGGAKNYGTVYSISTAGAENVLYSFATRADGEAPVGGLVDVNGTLYGTTSAGGRNGNYGTIFSISTAGVKKTLYSFSGIDGEYPEGTLINVNGVLFGPTFEGGASKFGTVFSFNTGSH